jgi:hypothetical protein
MASRFPLNEFHTGLALQVVNESLAARLGIFFGWMRISQ